MRKIIVFSTRTAGILGYLYRKKKKNRPHFRLHTKINSKLNVDLNIKVRSIEFLENSVGKRIFKTLG